MTKNLSVFYRIFKKLGTKNFFARSALYFRAHSQNWNVCSCVRKVITFCEEDMRGNHVPLDLGVLNDRFFRFWTVLKIFEKKVLEVYISMRIAHSENPVLNHFWSTFGELFWNLKKEVLTWIAWMKKVEELKDLGCSVRCRFYDLAWS